MTAPQIALCVGILGAALVAFSLLVIGGQLLWERISRPRPTRFDCDEAWRAFEEGSDTDT